jgi:hypothetical protein
VKHPVGCTARVAEDAAIASGFVNTEADANELRGISGATRKVPCAENTLRVLERIYWQIRRSEWPLLPVPAGALAERSH